MSKYEHYRLIAKDFIFLINILILFIFKNHRLLVSLSLFKYLTVVDSYCLGLNLAPIQANFEKKNNLQKLSFYSFHRFLFYSLFGQLIMLEAFRLSQSSKIFDSGRYRFSYQMINESVTLNFLFLVFFSIVLMIK